MGSLNTIDAVQPLILAVQCADTRTVRYVLNKEGIDVNGRDTAGSTALHHAAQLGRLEIIDLILDEPHVNDTLQNADRKQAYEVAQNGEMAHHMQTRRGTYIEKVNAQFQQALRSNDGSLEDLLDNPRASTLLNLNKPDSDGNTALHTAAASRNAPLAQLLLNHGADPFPRNKKGKLPSDLTKDDKIRAMFKNVPQKTLLNASPKDPIRYAGHLKKWTNYKSGYKARWFVLENGVLSYYRNQDESENACRGSINMRVAKIVYQNGDKSKFEVLGPDKNGFHVKAAHPTEAKNWIWNLNQAKTQARDAGKNPATTRDLTGAPIANPETASIDIPGLSSNNYATPAFSSYAPSVSGSMADQPVGIASQGLFEPTNTFSGEYAASFSDAESEIDVYDGDATVEPHRDVFGITANSAKVQLELMDQICDSLITDQTLNAGLEPRMLEAAQTFRSSATSLREVLSQLVAMASDRERFWKTSVEREREMRRLWEESMQALATDQDALERKVFEANVERRNTRKALKQARSELNQVRSSTPAVTPSADASNIQNPLSVPNVEPYVMDSDSSDDEFYDAVGSTNVSSTTLGRAPTQAVEAQSPPQANFQPVPVPIQTISTPVVTESQAVEQKPDPPRVQSETQPDPAPSKDALTVIKPSFHGYEAPIRSDMGRLDDRPSVSLWGILKSMIGKDMTKMTLPVSFNEATSLLQRVAEDMEYTDLLDKAAGMPDEADRALYVAAFAASEYASTIDRVAKPFNPLLHETYEYCRPDKGFRFVIEQVSHHPPIGAAHAESPNWEYYGESSVNSKFTGKSFDINPLGTWHLRLKLQSGGSELYTWKKVNTQVVGILLGSPTVDNYGPMIVINKTTGAEARLDFKARGWRGADAYKVTGIVKDSSGIEKWSVSGKWNDRLLARRTDDKSENTVIWSANPRKKGVPFNLTTFAMSLNAVNGSLQPWLPPTDTRLRPDQRAMEDGQYDFAATEKNRLEEKQRATRRKREKEGLESGARWFKKSRHPTTREEYWEFTGEYWDAREQRNWHNVENIF